MTCVGDVFDATAKQGFRPDQPYPGGIFSCHLTYLFPTGSAKVFALEMRRVEAPNWSMTFSDVADDLEALWYAALFFENRLSGFPEMNFDVYKFRQQAGTGNRGQPFLASRGNLAFTLQAMTNASVSNA